MSSRDLLRPLRFSKHGYTDEPGTYTTYSYDIRSRVDEIIHKKANNDVISSEAYVWDEVSNLESKTVDTVLTEYTYDEIDQLLSETRSGYAASYTYDDNGNRLTKTLN